MSPPKSYENALLAALTNDFRPASEIHRQVKMNGLARTKQFLRELARTGRCEAQQDHFVHAGVPFRWVYRRKQ